MGYSWYAPLSSTSSSLRRPPSSPCNTIRELLLDPSLALLLVVVIFTLFLGAMRSLSFLSFQAQQLSSEDREASEVKLYFAIVMPVLGSAMLLILFYFLDWLSVALVILFSISCFFAVVFFLDPVFTYAARKFQLQPEFRYARGTHAAAAWCCARLSPPPSTYPSPKRADLRDLPGFHFSRLRSPHRISWALCLLWPLLSLGFSSASGCSRTVRRFSSTQTFHPSLECAFDQAFPNLLLPLCSPRSVLGRNGDGTPSIAQLDGGKRSVVGVLLL